MNTISPYANDVVLLHLRSLNYIKIKLLKKKTEAQFICLTDSEFIEIQLLLFVASRGKQRTNSKIMD